MNTFLHKYSNIYLCENRGVTEKLMCKMLRGSKDFQFSFKPYEGRSCGILNIRDIIVFVAKYSYNMSNTLIVPGIFVTHINHYDLQEKIFLWQQLYDKVVGDSRPT
jgi:hypothetical protein